MHTLDQSSAHFTPLRVRACVSSIYTRAQPQPQHHVVSRKPHDRSISRVCHPSSASHARKRNTQNSPANCGSAVKQVAMAARRSGAVVAALMAVLVGLVGADFAADRAECADKLMGLATCLTYVQLAATARSPTPDCCSGFRQVLAASKKCLCVLVKDRDEPTLGIKFNVTRAMNLPSACNIPATFSDCPKILNMSPDSKEAEIFKQYGIEHEGKNATDGGAATGTSGGKSADAAAGAGRHAVVLAVVVSALLASVFVLA